MVQSLSRVRLLRLHGLQPTRLLSPWGFPGKNTGVDCHFLLQGIFPTQELNPGLLHCRQILYLLNYEGRENSHNIVMVFAIHQYEFATGIHVSHQILNPSPTCLPTLSLWVVPEHWLWVPCFMLRTCTGHLFYIWSCTCFSAILSKGDTDADFFFKKKEIC